MSVHSQYTSTVTVKVADPTTLLAVIWYSPLSLQVMSAIAIVRLVVVTVTLTSVTGVPLLVKLMCGGVLALSWKEKINCLPSVGVLLLVSVMLSLEGGGLASMEKESVSCPPSVGVAVAVEGKN